MISVQISCVYYPMAVSNFFRQTRNFVKRVMPPPDRWEQYCPLGKQIPGTPFIAFKVPLKETLLEKIKGEDRFSPKILVQTLESKGLKLGGIIDLTYTLRYYDKEEFENMSIKHEKVFTPGHEVPNHDVFHKFATAVKAIDKKGLLIGVHCTHGVNRTGYLICRYMIEEMDMEPDTAITLFNEARGHDLERENYLEDLRKRKKGESTYDPNYQPKEDPAKPNPTGGSQARGKGRWRHNRSDHPNWRQPNHEEANGAKPLDGDRLKESDNDSQREYNDLFMRYGGRALDPGFYQDFMSSRIHGGYHDTRHSDRLHEADRHRGREYNAWNSDREYDTRYNDRRYDNSRDRKYYSRHRYREYDDTRSSRWEYDGVRQSRREDDNIRPSRSTDDDVRPSRVEDDIRPSRREDNAVKPSRSENVMSSQREDIISSRREDDDVRPNGREDDDVRLSSKEDDIISSRRKDNAVRPSRSENVMSSQREDVISSRREDDDVRPNRREDDEDRSKGRDYDVSGFEESNSNGKPYGSKHQETESVDKSGHCRNPQKRKWMWVDRSVAQESPNNCERENLESPTNDRKKKKCEDGNFK